ncbi:MAG: DUF4357 domain-containing protein [Phycisphaerae bacterium]|nr:DUF4357 domain-containing protein [Phycisphaerae bacterium]
MASVLTAVTGGPGGGAGGPWAVGWWLVAGGPGRVANPRTPSRITNGRPAHAMAAPPRLPRTPRPRLADHRTRHQPHLRHSRRLFTEAHTFNTPSSAAIAMLGRSANGWKEWKTADGATLDEVKRQPVLDEHNEPS